MITIKTYNRIYKAFNEPEPTNYVCLKNEHPSSAANFVTESEMKSPINLEYSLDNKTWNNYDMTNKPTISVPAGGYVYLRGVNTGVKFDVSSFFNFGLNKKFSTGGDIRTLLNYQDVNSVTKIPDYAFYCCFDNNNNNNITSCTWDMSGITEVGNYGFAYCFDGCRSLTTPPDFSKVTTVGKNGFDACFDGCRSLTTPPNFSKVTSVGEYGFAYCFNGCKKLKRATAPKVTTWDTNKFYYWLANVASYGVVRKPANLTIPRDVSGVPAGWRTENY